MIPYPQVDGRYRSYFGAPVLARLTSFRPA